MKRCLIHVAGAFALVFAAPIKAEEILVAVASNFMAPAQELAAEFAAQSGHEPRLAFGASGRFYAQIVNAAPFQVFLSADAEKPRLLVEQGLAVAGSRFTYASGKLALWSNDASLNVSGPDALRQSTGKLAMANPALAPYGGAAQQVLHNLGLLEFTRGRWVQGENIAQTFQFVQTGNAQLGFVALSQVINRAEAGSFWLINEELYEPISQDAVLLQSAAECMACQQFLDFLDSRSARQIIARFGYD